MTDHDYELLRLFFIAAVGVLLGGLAVLVYFDLAKQRQRQEDDCCQEEKKQAEAKNEEKNKNDNSSGGASR